MFATPPKLVFFVVLAALAAASCGTGESRSLSAGSTSTTQPAAAASSERKTPPNRNRTDTALGRVCWFHEAISVDLAELATSALVLKEAAQPEPSATREIIRELKELVANAPSQLGDVRDLPPKARGFRDALQSAAANADSYLKHVSDDADASARRKAFDDLAAMFNFFDDKSVSSRDFVESVKNDTTDSCPNLTGEAKKKPT